MKRPIAIVTGAAGFIGGHMCDLLLSRGYHVRAIDNLSGGHKKNISQHDNHPSFEFYQEDILDIPPNSTIFNNTDYVFHFAGIGDIVPSIEKPFDYMNINVMGTVKILEASRYNHVKKLVYAASSSCYGLANTPTDENHPVNPQYPYALSKYQGEMAAFHWHRIYKLPMNSIRIFNAYGTRVRTTGAYGAVFGVFLKQLLENKPLTVVGDGSQKRDFLYVTDIARAFLMAAETNLSGQIWNLGAGKPESINYLVKLLGATDIDYLPKRPGEPDCTHANTIKIMDDLSWEPTIPFEEGVNKMLVDIQHWKDAPLWDRNTIKRATKVWFESLS